MSGVRLVPFHLILICLLLRRLLFLIRPPNPRSLSMVSVTPESSNGRIFVLLSQPIVFPKFTQFPDLTVPSPSADYKKLALLVLSKAKPGFDNSTVSKLCTTLIKSHKLNVCDDEMYCIVNVVCSRTSWPVSFCIVNCLLTTVFGYFYCLLNVFVGSGFDSQAGWCLPRVWHKFLAGIALTPLGARHSP